MVATLATTLLAYCAVAEPPAGDLNGDWGVDLLDLRLFADQWLNPQGLSADFDGDAEVDLHDFGLFGRDWLQSACPVVINEIHSNPDVETELVEFVELHNAGTKEIDLSGWSFTAGVSYTFPPGITLPAGGFLIVAENPDHIHRKWSAGRFGIDAKIVFGPYDGRLENDGERIAICDALGQVIDEVDYQLGFPWPTVGDPLPAQAIGRGSSMQLVNPRFDNDLAGSWRSALPTPAARNIGVYAENIGPHLRQLRRSPEQPAADDEVMVTIKATDPDGVGSMTLEYQVVSAGRYVPAFFAVPLGTLQSNPDTPPTWNADYLNPANWTQLAMNDDGTNGDVVAGDNIYSVVLPKQANRTLLRYRIVANDRLGNSLVAPYADDPSLNFAYYVYDGVPDYEGFSPEKLRSLPVYQLLTRAEDMYHALGYSSSDQISQFLGGSANPARFVYNWYGTFVCGGDVYDNIKYRLRGGNGRYMAGNTKRSMRFRFNRGHYFQAKDMEGEPYTTKWRTLTTAKGFDNRATLTYSLNEHVNFFLYNKLGVPAPYSHYFHFRVVDGEQEAPDPWHGDFWGLWFAQETYDVRFLEAHGLAKGNLYKLINSVRDAKGQQRYEAPGAVTDGSDFNTIEYNLTGHSTADFIRNHVRLDRWYVYHALAQAVRHYDFWPDAGKNATWYFEPDYTPENNYQGLMWTLPWDTDASWGPTWNNGHDVVYNSIFPASGSGSDSASTPELQPDYYNAVREVRDLLWQRDQIEPLLDTFAAPLIDLAAADRVRWLNSPSDAGNYNGLSGAGKNGLPALVQDMKNFAFVGGSWPGGGVGAGGRAAFLDSLADGTDGHLIPDRPSASYSGEPGWPSNALRFQVSPFSDPQSDHTFAAMKWRIAEVSPGSEVIPPTEGVTLIPDGAQWTYFKGTKEPPPRAGAWRLLDYDETGWQVGRTAIGYGETFIVTNLGDMRGGYTTIYLRKTFEVESLADFDELMLEVKYDDGINLWINGKLVVQENVSSAELAYDATADSAIENTSFVGYLLSKPEQYVVRGANVIAAQVLNASISGSSDCLIDVRLTGQKETGGGQLPGQTSSRGWRPGKYEIEAVWDSGELTEYAPDVTIPASVVRPGRTYRVRCKMKDNTGRWSHWSDAVQFEAAEPLSQGVLADLRVIEVMYNPADPPPGDDSDSDDFEFIELKNVGDEVLDLSYVSFVDGVTFDFSESDVRSLGPGEFMLIVKNKQAFLSRYGVGLAGAIAGEYDGRLANGGENVALVDFWNGTIAEFEYGDGRGWPLAADGAGHSLVPLESSLLDQPKGSLNYGGNWRVSTYIGGSPGRDDPEPVKTVAIDEVMAHTDYSNPAHPEYESNDWVELYNASDSGVSLADYYLSDDLDDLMKWDIPAITIPSRAGLSLDEVTGFHNPINSGFGLNKAGEQVILSYLPGNSQDRVVDWVLFKGQERGVSLGRYPTGGPYWFRMSPSQDSANSDPVLDLQIDELMYHPVDPNEEYVELHNPTAWAISLQNDAGQWRLDGGVEYTFPVGLSVPAGGRLLVVGFHPEAEPSRLNEFMAAYNTGALAPGIDIVGPWSGALSNRGERAALEKPEMPDQPGDSVSWVIVDEVIYGDVAPWPEAADGSGDALQRIHTDQYHSGNDPANWTSAAPTPGSDG